MVQGASLSRKRSGVRIPSGLLTRVVIVDGALRSRVRRCSASFRRFPFTFLRGALKARTDARGGATTELWVKARDPYAGRTQALRLCGGSREHLRSWARCAPPSKRRGASAERITSSRKRRAAPRSSFLSDTPRSFQNARASYTLLMPVPVSWPRAASARYAGRSGVRLCLQAGQGDIHKPRHGCRRRQAAAAAMAWKAVQTRPAQKPVVLTPLGQFMT